VHPLLAGPFLGRVTSALVALSVPAGLAIGQQAPVSAAATTPDLPRVRFVSEERYEPVFDQLQKIALQGERVAPVRNLALRRDVIEFDLEQGKLYLATPVARRTISVVFVGHGSVSFTPPLAVERAQLQRVLGDSVLKSQISAAVFVFTDSTLAELERQLTFGAGRVSDDASGVLHEAIDHLVDAGTRQAEEPTLMTALLNGETNGFFYSHVKREHGEDLMFLVDPQQEEQIALLRGGRVRGQRVQIVCQFKRAEGLRDTASVARERRDPLKLEAYAIETTIGKNLEFSATARIRVTARGDGVRWARFLLFPELAVDSLHDEAGTADTFFRVKQSPEVWLRFDAPLHAGETRSVRVMYHGDVLGYRSVMDELRRRLENRLPRARWPVSLPSGVDKWFFVKASQTWFPRYGPSNPRYVDWPAADMDLTFHTPRKYRFVSVGHLMDTRDEGDVRTTRWVTERPASEASFNLGEFDEFKITDPRIPPVTVQMNVDAHREFDALLRGQLEPEKDVGGDVANSLAFFTHVFGPPLFERYYATEIPFPYGQAFPGLMYLSMMTFQSVNESGAEETFRAHEMAHQWWGIGVEPEGYRDVWLSEGFAEFSGLWYMQTILKDNDKFFKQLRDRRHDILARRNTAPPIGLGWRVAQTDDPSDYSLVIYQKGAWVLHMLRNLMLDLRTMREDAFTATMQDFYQQYRGRRASTQDFQRVVERHTGLPMSWFFDQWVDGTAIPTYILSWHADPPQDGHYLLRVRVRQEGVPKNFVMPVPLKIEFADGGQAFVRVNVTGSATEGTLSLPAEPTRLELNPLESVLADVKTEAWP